MKVVKDFDIGRRMTVDQLVREMTESGGFTSKKLGVGIEILEQMLKEKDSLKFLSFPADIISTGTRGVIRELIRQKWFDVVVTTCGTLDHDLARSFGDYHHGEFEMDDVELHKNGVYRLGNILIENDAYSKIIEEKVSEFLSQIHGKHKELSTYELCWEIGKRINNKESILYWASRNKIPMVIPGITDGAVGYHLWQFSQDHDLKIDILKDEKLLSDMVWNSKKAGALIVGGGISKHHVIWWSQFTKGLDYAVYVTTAHEFDGSLSGARTKEAISWGKIKENANHVTIQEDATIALPIIYAALKDRIG